MSSTLGWIPVKPKELKYLDQDLKFAMRNRYGDPVNAELDLGDLAYLQGLSDAGIKDAKKLIAGIEKHGEIHVKEEF